MNNITRETLYSHDHTLQLYDAQKQTSQVCNKIGEYYREAYNAYIRGDTYEPCDELSREAVTNINILGKDYSTLLVNGISLYVAKIEKPAIIFHKKAESYFMRHMGIAALRAALLPFATQLVGKNCAILLQNATLMRYLFIVEETDEIESLLEEYFDLLNDEVLYTLFSTWSPVFSVKATKKFFCTFAKSLGQREPDEIKFHEVAQKIYSSRKKYTELPPQNLYDKSAVVVEYIERDYTNPMDEARYERMRAASKEHKPTPMVLTSEQLAVLDKIMYK